MKQLCALVLLVGLLGCTRSPAPDYTSTHFKVVKLTEGVYACIHKFGGKAICNVGIVDNGKESIVFDTFLSPDVAAEIQNVVDHYGLSPIKFVVNSHAHNDHIRGNQVFPEEVAIISTRRTAELIHQWEQQEIPAEMEYAPPMVSHYDSLIQHFHGDTSGRAYKKLTMWLPYYQTLAESHLKVRTRLPDLIMEDSLVLDGPHRKVRLIDRGAGHTESDAMLFLPDDQIIFAGDLVFEEMHPYMGHGHPASWIAYLEYMESLRFQTLVPGHGELCGRKAITAMKSYIHDMEMLAIEMIREGMGVDQTPEIHIPDAYQDWWFENFFVSNLRFVFSNLEEQD